MGTEANIRLQKERKRRSFTSLSTIAESTGYLAPHLKTLLTTNKLCSHSQPLAGGVEVCD